MASGAESRRNWPLYIGLLVHSATPAIAEAIAAVPGISHSSWAALVSPGTFVRCRGSGASDLRVSRPIPDGLGRIRARPLLRTDNRLFVIHSLIGLVTGASARRGPPGKRPTRPTTRKSARSVRDKCRRDYSTAPYREPHHRRSPDPSIPRTFQPARKEDIWNNLRRRGGWDSCGPTQQKR